MFRAFAFAAALVVAVPAVAQEAVDSVRPGRVLRDTNGQRLGKVDRVNPDGSVRIIFEERFVTIPADKLAVADGQARTTLTRREVARLR
ncbi:MAG: hypothetical protein NZM40_07765 [Sphingomonadaceae bacterium]|uniref:hypothetical protein n=1 Tax=Thermaurantiacus sp. TaxID=2820283 RepID=UPI00298F2CA5|nr:hypothetical protein [Thermaurantiacus sp.]MCS6987308.1 hypothetical protein [Sphingomonadaceae bacterium]MDW8414528.1 hypothetical protein [Thermaurantiacus sp.]